MVSGSDEIGVRGSTWSSVFIVGAGAPGGVREPWAKTRDGGQRTKVAMKAAIRGNMGWYVFIVV